MEKVVYYQDALQCLFGIIFPSFRLNLSRYFVNIYERFSYAFGRM